MLCWVRQLAGLQKEVVVFATASRVSGLPTRPAAVACIGCPVDGERSCLRDGMPNATGRREKKRRPLTSCVAIKCMVTNALAAQRGGASQQSWLVRYSIPARRIPVLRKWSNRQVGGAPTNSGTGADDRPLNAAFARCLKKEPDLQRFLIPGRLRWSPDSRQ